MSSTTLIIAHTHALAGKLSTSACTYNGKIYIIAICFIIDIFEQNQDNYASTRDFSSQRKRKRKIKRERERKK